MKISDQHMDLEYFLKKVPLFSSIPNSQIREIASCFHFAEFKKDSIIFMQDDLSDSMYIIRSGAIMITTRKGNKPIFETELRRGNFFGEMALLSDLPRNSSARVSLDATLYYIKKEDFNTLLTRNKHIGLFLSRLYARRLSSGTDEQSAVPKDPTFYTISATGPNLGLSHFLYSMSFHISTESKKRVLVIEPHLELKAHMQNFDLRDIPCPDESLFSLLPSNLYQMSDFNWFYHPSGFTVLQVNQGFKEKLVPVLPHLMESLKLQFDMVVFSLSHRFGNFEKQAVRLCDKNLLLINNTEAGLADVKNRLDRMEKTAGTGFDRVRVGVSHLCGSRGIARETLKKELNLSETPQIWVDRSDKAFNKQIDTEKRFPIKGARAVAREIAGVRIGLALGAGAARGWAHIGVLKVLEENGIHIDMISGTSMGALVGAIFAAKGCVDHLRQSTIDLFQTRYQARKQIFDYSFPFKGFLKGQKAMKLVSTAVDNADFMDLVIPTYLIGVDILKGEEVLFETGDVSKAVRSSLSLPAVFYPFKHKGRWMVDGGLINPVPVDVLEQKGADKIIAVCVEKKGTSQDYTEKSPSIMEVIQRTISIVHGRATSGFAQKSDVVVYPDVQGFNWDDFHQGQTLMQRGAMACEEVIDEIKTLVQ